MEQANGVYVTNMLTYKEAVRKILKHSFPLRPRQVPLEKSLGLVLAKDIFALESLPNFDNSAVDGYAISLRSNGSDPSGPLKLQGEVKAGEFFKGTAATSALMECGGKA